MGKKFPVISSESEKSSWSNSNDFADYVRPTVRKKSNLIIIHTGTNYIQNNVNTFQKMRKIISSIKEYDTDDNIKITFLSRIKLMKQTES